MNIRDKFLKFGYVIVPKVYDTLETNSIKDIAAKIFSGSRKNWNSKVFNKKIAILRKKNPEKFSYLYNTLQSNILLKKLASNRNVINNIKKILNIDESNISHSICHMRIDSFVDDRNSYDWHQERSYYPQNEDGNGIVVWIALMDIKKNLGPLHALKGSHHEGFVKSKKIKKKNYSTQHKISDTLIEKYKDKLKVFELNEGDAIFMNMNTFHRSGKNNSKKFRLSIVSRYHDNSKYDFRPFYDTGNYFYSKMKNSDLKRLF